MSNEPYFKPLDFEGFRIKTRLKEAGNDRLLKLNEIDIIQMCSLLSDNNIKRLK